MRLGFSPLAVRSSRRTRPALELLEDRLVPVCTSTDPGVCAPINGHDGLAMHIHPELSIFANNVRQEIPADIGIENGQMLPLHTHDNTGRLHVEAPVVRDFKLKHFITDIWNQPLSATQVMGFTGRVTMTVNGQPNTEFGELVLRDNQRIEIRVDTSTPAQAGTLQFSTPVYTVAANAGSVTATVSRSNGTDGAVTVNYATSDGSGRDGVDYVATSGTLNFAAGETSKTFTVSILNSNATGIKTFNVTLANPGGGATLGTLGRATVTITNVRPPVDPVVNRNYVTQVYRDFYGREVDASGLTTWAGALDGGTSRTDVLVSLSGTPECYTKMVTKMYRDLLGRTPDSAGLAGFTDLMARGSTAEQIRAIICGSDEYFRANGGNNAQFLENIYQDVLGRGLDAAGRDGFIRALAGGATRGQIADVIYRSAEFRERLVQSVYQEYFSRPADPSGLSYWTDALRQGVREQHMRVGFLTAPEYVDRYARA